MLNESELIPCKSDFSHALLVTVGEGEEEHFIKHLCSLFALRLEFQMSYIIPTKTDSEMYCFDLYSRLVSVLQPFQFSVLLSTIKLQRTKSGQLSFTR